MYPHRRIGTEIRHSSHSGMSYYVHPMALDVPSKIRHASDQSHDRNVTTVHNPIQIPPAVSPPTTSVKPMTMDRGAEERLAQAAKQLHEQAKESMGIYQSFFDKYNQDISSVRDYVDTVTRRRIWQSKIAQNTQYSQEQEGEDQQLVYQVSKLQVCFDHFSDAAGYVTLQDEPSDANAYNSRYFLLDKIAHAYNRVKELARKTMMNEGACPDLINELQELHDLVDPEKPTARVIYRFDKRGIMPISADTVTMHIDGAEAGNYEGGQAEAAVHWG
ncbi:hypothetical protein PFICI_13270 [Pestalotiopsis fici W106-1]|uniref:Uncharacterized protein n=1 Tax=Pestalotiopsis fici (strain W106-1 / CGMCC3.15140) TaxID=1229662 RepID=W3WPP3_PESFW|nr:uncharacterized protein PFICI_13270 [Pestalotiopsis fici W106-1]ETS74786.1 hypothetical protein PFICI_13270 [Pestalotiopsis fici W106-1]